MQRRDYIERELEKMVQLLGTILGLKKSSKPLLEIISVAEAGFKDLFGDDFLNDESSILKLSGVKQQALANIFFELGITAYDQQKPEACQEFLKQYLMVIHLVEKNSDTFSVQNMRNKGIVEKILLEL